MPFSPLAQKGETEAQRISWINPSQKASQWQNRDQYHDSCPHPTLCDQKYPLAHRCWRQPVPARTLRLKP